MDLIDQLRAAMTMTENLVSELRASGCHDFTIASALMITVGGIYRQQIPDDANRRLVVLHAAEVAITGREQPITGMFSEPGDGEAA